MLTEGSSGYTSFTNSRPYEKRWGRLNGASMKVIHTKLLDFNEANIKHLRDIINRICDDPNGKQEAFAAAAKWHKSDLSRWLNGKERNPISHERYLKLLAFAVKTEAIPPLDFDPFSYAISGFLEYPSVRRMKRHSDFEGEYALYRYSLLAVGHIL